MNETFLRRVAACLSRHAFPVSVGALLGFGVSAMTSCLVGSLDEERTNQFAALGTWAAVVVALWFGLRELNVQRRQRRSDQAIARTAISYDIKRLASIARHDLEVLIRALQRDRGIPSRDDNQRSLQEWQGKVDRVKSFADELDAWLRFNQSYFAQLPIEQKLVASRLTHRVQVLNSPSPYGKKLPFTVNDAAEARGALRDRIELLIDVAETISSLTQGVMKLTPEERSAIQAQLADIHRRQAELQSARD